MLDILKRFLPRQPLPPHIHFHIDAKGNEVFCDESICRPVRPSLTDYFAQPR